MFGVSDRPQDSLTASYDVVLGAAASWHTLTSDDLPRVIQGRYKLVARLAQGGMGVTYRAWDDQDGVPVVIKMPRIDLRTNVESQARFLREIKAMQAVRHENIVPILNQGIEDGCPFLVLRLLPGGSLAEHRRVDSAGNPIMMPLGLLKIWLPPIAEALDAIHAHDMLHRDVKPGNIFLDGFMRPFLGDFGIAKVVGDAAGLSPDHTLTASQMSVGTPEYMAPELFMQKGLIDGRSDQYALAVTVFELLAGQKPFTGTNAHIILEHATLEPPSLADFCPGIDDTIAAAVSRAMAKNPEDRFNNCSDFAAEIVAKAKELTLDRTVHLLFCPACRQVLRVKTSAGGKQGRCSKCEQRIRIAADLGSIWLSEEETAGTSTPSLKPDDTAGTLVARELKTTPSHYAAAGGNSLTEDYGRQLYCFMAMLIAGSALSASTLNLYGLYDSLNFRLFTATSHGYEGALPIFLVFSQFPCIMLVFARGRPFFRCSLFFCLAALTALLSDCFDHSRLPEFGLVANWVVFFPAYTVLRAKGWAIDWKTLPRFPASEKWIGPARIVRKHLAEIIFTTALSIVIFPIVAGLSERPNFLGFIGFSTLHAIFFAGSLIALPGLKTVVRGLLLGMIIAIFAFLLLISTNQFPQSFFVAFLAIVIPGVVMILCLSWAGVLTRLSRSPEESATNNATSNSRVSVPAINVDTSMAIAAATAALSTAIRLYSWLYFSLNNSEYVAFGNADAVLVCAALVSFLCVFCGYLAFPALPARLSFFSRSLRNPWWRRVRGASTTERADSGYARLATFGLRILDSERLMKGLLIGAAVLVLLRWLAYLR